MEFEIFLDSRPDDLAAVPGDPSAASESSGPDDATDSTDAPEVEEP